MEKMTNFQASYKISMVDLQGLVNKYGDSLTREGIVDIQNEEDIEYLFSEMNDFMRSILKSECGFYVDNDNFVYWNTKGYDGIVFWTNVVDECYEGLLSETNLWNDFFGFGGDDDVDYNSSYISAINNFFDVMWRNGYLNDYLVD
jgi:hypothetical protein